MPERGLILSKDTNGDGHSSDAAQANTFSWSQPTPIGARPLASPPPLNRRHSRGQSLLQQATDLSTVKKRNDTKKIVCRTRTEDLVQQNLRPYIDPQQHKYSTVVKTLSNMSQSLLNGLQQDPTTTTTVPVSAGSSENTTLAEENAINAMLRLNIPLVMKLMHIPQLRPTTERPTIDVQR